MGIATVAVSKLYIASRRINICSNLESVETVADGELWTGAGKQGSERKAVECNEIN
jgi:hypothetical protein